MGEERSLRKSRKYFFYKKTVELFEISYDKSEFILKALEKYNFKF